MSLNIGTLVATLRLDDSGWTSGLDKATEKLKATAAEMRAVGAAALGIAAAMGGVAALAIKAASDFDETSNKITVGFGSSSVKVEEWAAKTAEAMGRGRQSVREGVSDFQALIAPMIGNQKAAEGMSKRMTELAIDLGSFHNIPMKEALANLRSGLIGQSEPMLKFGVNIQETALKEFALAKGIEKTTENMSIAEKTMLRYEMIIKGTSLAHGDAINTAGSFANQLARLQGNAEGLAVAIGTPLKNALAPLLFLVNEISVALIKMDPETATLIAKVTLAAIAITGLVGGLLLAGGAITGLVAVMPAVIAGLGALFTTVLPVIVILGTLIVIIGKMYGIWLEFGNVIVPAVKNAFNSVLGAAGSVGQTILNVFNYVVGKIVDAFLLIPGAILKSFTLIIEMIAFALGKIRPLLKLMGLEGMADAALQGSQSLTAVASRMDSMLENTRQMFKDTLNPANALGHLIDGAKEVGGFIIESVKDGLQGAHLLLRDLLGVTADAQGLQTATAGADQAQNPNSRTQTTLAFLKKAEAERQKAELDLIKNTIDEDKRFLAGLTAEKKREAELEREKLKIQKDINDENLKLLKAADKLAEDQAEAARKQMERNAQTIATIASAAISGSGFSAAGGALGKGVGTAASVAAGDPTGLIGGAIGGGVGAVLGSLIDKLPSFVAAGEAVMNLLTELVAPLDSFGVPIKYLVEQLHNIAMQFIAPLAPIFKRFIEAIVTIVVKLVIAFAPFFTLWLQWIFLIPLLTEIMRIMIPILEAMAKGMDAFVRVMLDVANFAIDIANAFIGILNVLNDTKIKAIKHLHETGTYASETEKDALKKAKAEALATAREEAIAEAKRKIKERMEQEANDLAGAGNLNLPEAFKLAAARMGATGDDPILGGTGNSPGSERPIVYVYINGSEVKDLVSDERFDAVVDSGIPLKAGRRPWSGGKMGN